MKSGMSDLNIVEACLMENFNDKWIIDSGVTNHVLLLFAVVSIK